MSSVQLAAQRRAAAAREKIEAASNVSDAATRGEVAVCVAVCCSVLQCVAVCCSVLQCAAVCCRVLQCAAVCGCVLQCASVCCSVLQCVTVCGSVLQCSLDVWSACLAVAVAMYTHTHNVHMSQKRPVYLKRDL